MNVLVGLLILKQQNLLSDEELIGSLYFDYRFQYALGLEANADKERLCVNTISNFRCRLVEHELQTGENLLQQEMESLAEKMADFLSLNKSLARMDSTMLDSSCKKMTRIELVYTVIRNMVKEVNKVPGLDIPESYLAYLEKGHKNQTIYKTKSAEEASKLESLIYQAYDLHAWVKDTSVALDTDAFAHLSRLLQEQSIETEDGVAVPIEGSKLSSRVLQNPSDPDATFRHKGGDHHIGQ
ncbi:transposase [Natribacillus halophilus]|uniref:transposase n=1 Tax=Natribacillus halophilus TaxID=549003 RepID=UPI0015A15813|nr:transposase [Natribacillus halophilus]